VVPILGGGSLDLVSDKPFTIAAEEGRHPKERVLELSRPIQKKKKRRGK